MVVKYKAENKTTSSPQPSAQPIAFNNIMALPTATVNAVFNALCEVGQTRAVELEKYGSKTLLDKSDDEKDVGNQCLKPFSNSLGPGDVRKLTNFSPTELKHNSRYH